MRTLMIATVSAAACAVAVIGPAGTAAALPHSGTAADVQSGLEAQGYRVQINGIVTGQLSECTTTGVHPRLSDSSTAEERANTTVFIDVSCPPE